MTQCALLSRQHRRIPSASASYAFIAAEVATLSSSDRQLGARVVAAAISSSRVECSASRIRLKASATVTRARPRQHLLISQGTAN